MITIFHVFRERQYSSKHKYFCKWFEKCPTIAQTTKFITVKSETYSTIHYPGGEFRLSIAKLKVNGFHHHTRHGERFWLEQPKQGDLFPTQQLLDMPSALDYEAIDLGWDMNKPRWELEQWQKECYLIAKSLDNPLKEIVHRWKFGGESALRQMWAEVREKSDGLIAEFYKRKAEE